MTPPIHLLPLLLLLALVVPGVVGEYPQETNVAIYGANGEHYQTTAHLVNGTYFINMTGIPQYETRAVSYNVGNTIEYPQQYYSLGQQSYDEFTKSQNEARYNPATYGVMSATWLELRRQTILMEKQNEMIYQQNMWQRNATLNCVRAHAGNYCQEYAWVGGA